MRRGGDCFVVQNTPTKKLAAPMSLRASFAKQSPSPMREIASAEERLLRNIPSRVTASVFCEAVSIAEEGDCFG